MGMGDMKTPDFDDLLAAFDIPDIDAKDAIQSEPDGNHNERSGVIGKERSGSPCLRPPESPEPVPSAPHNDPSMVSVIVKNSVHSDDITEGNVTEGTFLVRMPHMSLPKKVPVKTAWCLQMSSSIMDSKPSQMCLQNPLHHQL